MEFFSDSDSSKAASKNDVHVCFREKFEQNPGIAEVASFTWHSTDPIEFEGNDTNLYRYVKNASIIFCDNSGLAPNPLGGFLRVYKDLMKEVYKGLPGLVPLAINQYWKVTDHEKSGLQELENAEALANALGWNSFSLLHLVISSPKEKILDAVQQLQKELGDCYSVSHRFYGTVVYKKGMYRDRWNIERPYYLFNFTYYSELTILDKTVTPSQETIELDILAYGSFPLDSNGKIIDNEARGQFLF